jgi:septin family protein
MIYILGTRIFNRDIDTYSIQAMKTMCFAFNAIPLFSKCRNIITDDEVKKVRIHWKILITAKTYLE